MADTPKPTPATTKRPYVPAMLSVQITGKALEGYHKLREQFIAKGVALGGPADVIVRTLEAAAE